MIVEWQHHCLECAYRMAALKLHALYSSAISGNEPVMSQSIALTYGIVAYLFIFFFLFWFGLTMRNDALMPSNAHLTIAYCVGMAKRLISHIRWWMSMRRLARPHRRWKHALEMCAKHIKATDTMSKKLPVCDTKGGPILYVFAADSLLFTVHEWLAIASIEIQTETESKREREKIVCMASCKILLCAHCSYAQIIHTLLQFDEYMSFRVHYSCYIYWYISPVLQQTTTTATHCPWSFWQFQVNG